MQQTGSLKKNLLIIDSSLLIIKRLISLLKEKKLVKEIFAATDIKQAVTHLQNINLDIVLLDIQLPGKNGIELLKFINKNYPEIKVIVFSNLVSNYYQRLCKSNGATCFIDKSKDFDQVPEVILSI